MALQPSPAVVRAGEVLTFLAAHPTGEFTMSELARELGVPRATCNSLVLGLVEGGFVHRTAGRRYQLGPACIALGDAARSANPALRAASVHAEALAREHGLVMAVTIRSGQETRVANVFDFGPPFVVRPRAGEAIVLVPPFGASFVAWDSDTEIDAWLDRADPPLSPAEATRYRQALAAVRRRRYSVTVTTARNPELADALERLAGQPDADEARRRRDQAIRAMTHSEYLAAEIDADRTTRLNQVSAPVFEPGGRVAASIMLLGPDQELTKDEIAALGDLVVAAAARATRETGGAVPAARTAHP
jgi:DNA-binding IclR family transcriptional regulator